MAFEFRLPDIGEGLAEAEIISWRVAIGDTVAMDQVVVDVETDKAVVEIPIPVAGTVLHLGGSEGETVEVGTVLIVVGESGEAWPAPSDEPALDADPADSDSDPEAAPDPDSDPEFDPEFDPAADSDAAGDPAGAAPIVGSLGNEVTVLGASSTTEPHAVSGVKALPVVRKLAREVGVDLETVAGTGPDGRITRDDVTAAAEGSSEPRVAEYRSGTPEPAEQPEDTEADEPGAGGYRNGTAEPRVEDSAGRAMSRVRRTIAERVSRSWAEIPHVTTFDEVDATRLLEVKKALTRRTGVAISIDALVVRAVVPALESHPDFNAHLDGDVLRDNETLDMGVAVDTDDGLMLVVVRDVSTQTLTEISGEIARLAVAAKARTATPDEMSGQTFTVSNIGAVGGGYGTPIIPHGTIGILSVGRAVERPVAREGKVVVAPMMPLSLSYDHRVIDGGAGRRFLAEVVENLTEPALFLAD